MPKNGFRQQAQKPAAAALQAQFYQALALHQQGKLAEAERIYVEILQRTPIHFDALHMLGVLAVQTRRPERGAELIGKAIKLNAMNAAAHSNLGNALLDLKRFKDALASYDKAIELKPDYAEAYNNRGNALKDLKRPEDALQSYGKAIELKPDYAEAYNNRGNTLLELKRLEEALASYAKAIALKPDYAKAHNSRGFLLLQLNRPEEALASCDKAIALKSANAETHFTRGAALKALKQLAAAIASYDKAIAAKPDYAEAYNNRGNALRDLKRHDEALTNYDKAIALKPDYAEAYYNRGNLFLDLKRFEDALANYDKAIALKPDYADAYNNRGSLLMDIKRYEDALSSYDKAIALNPGHAGAYNNRGSVLLDLRRPEDALASYGKAIALKPEYAEAHRNRGLGLSDLKRYDEAFTAFDKAFALKPELPGAEGDRLYHKMRICEWSNFDAECAHLISSVRNARANTSPFTFLAVPSSSTDQLQCAKLWIANKHPIEKSIWQGERYEHDRIRVAYLSADFHDHPMAHLMAGLFESHDRKQFETFAFSFGPDVKSDVRTRLEAAFDRFIDVSDMSDRDVAMLMRELEIDIAVDRKGFTKNCRTGIFAFRAAPIQVNYLAYPGTMGAEYIDYILADRIVIPEDHRRYYSEKVVYLPESYQANDSKRRIADLTPTRAELGLPAQGFVFCCFNNIYKVTPDIFDCWMRMLGQVEGSVLWLMDDNKTAIANLRNEAAARGVNPERLVFAKRLPLPDHLARHRLADLFVDTLPYNAHTTASDALWAGLPVLTCRGETFAGRVAASLLNAIRLPELITTTLEAYERMAIELATHPEKLTAIKRKLAENRLSTPLFDTKSFTQQIEAAYAAMHERHQAGLPPEHIAIPN